MSRKGFGTAGSSRSLRRTASAVGVGSTARERDRRAMFGTVPILYDPDVEAIRQAIATQQCCWCDDPRTFVSLSAHLVKGHGLDLAELRERLVLPKRSPMVSSELSARFAARPNLDEAVARMRAAPRSGHHDLTAYGRRAQAERIAKLTPEARVTMIAKARETYLQRPAEERRTNARRAGLSVSPECHRRAGRLGGRVRARQMAEPGVRAAMIAKRETNEGYRVARSEHMRAMQRDVTERARKAHDCERCGTRIPTSTRRFCSPECVSAWRRERMTGAVRRALPSEP